MPPPALKPEVREHVIELLKAGVPRREIRRLTKVSIGSISNIALDAGLTSSGVKPNSTEPDEYVRDNGDTRRVAKILPGSKIQTLEDAIAAMQIDTGVWHVAHWEAGTWNVALKVGAKEKKRVQVEQLFRVRMTLKRLIPLKLSNALDLVYKRFRDHAPKYPLLPKVKAVRNPHLGVFGLFDAHFGKLAWAAETGQDYDLKIADTVYRNAVLDLLAESKHRDLERAVLPLGNDFFHFDNVRGQTTGGTQLDTDGRYAKVLATGKLAFIWAVEQLAALCPVDIPVVPGNHDYHASIHLGHVIDAWFRGCRHVTVDLGPSPRKYVVYGDTLLGFDHGRDINPASLPGLMAQERPKEWGASKYREWLIGDGHRTRKWETKTSDTHQGTIVRMLQSLAGTDAWHHSKGFTGTRQAAEVYWYHRDTGYAGHGVVEARR